MRVRYRNLSRSFDDKAYASMVSAAGEAAHERHMSRPFLLRGDSSGGLGAEIGASVAGLLTAPSAVSCEEAEGELEEVRAMLARGDLEPTDLVDMGDGWQTFRECYPFEEQCDAYDRLPFWRRNRRSPRRRSPLRFQFRPWVWSWVPLYLLLLFALREPFRGQGSDPLWIYATVMTAFLSHASLQRSVPAPAGVAGNWAKTHGWTGFCLFLVHIPLMVLRYAFDVSGVPILLVSGLLGALSPVPQFLFQARLGDPADP